MRVDRHVNMKYEIIYIHELRKYTKLIICDKMFGKKNCYVICVLGNYHQKRWSEMTTFFFFFIVAEIHNDKRLEKYNIIFALGNYQK